MEVGLGSLTGVGFETAVSGWTGVEIVVCAGFGVEIVAWAGVEVGALWGTGFVEVAALFGVDERARLIGIEKGVTELEQDEPEAGFGAGLESGQTVTGLFGGTAGADCGFGVGVVGAGHAW